MKDLFKILSGKVYVKINGLTIIVGPFSFEDHYIAALAGEDAYAAAFNDGSYTEDEAFSLLKDNNWWTDENEEFLNTISKNIERMKLDYFNNFYNFTSRSYIASNIESQKQKFFELASLKNSFLPSTCEYAKSQAYQMVLVQNGSRWISGEPVDFNTFPISTLLLRYQREILSDDQIRGVAKDPEFKFLWRAHKEIIKEPPISDMKTSLINWAQVYDNVGESPDCPTDDIMYDDYALDGWFIFQRNKSEQERKENTAKSKLGDKLSKAGEIFMPYKTEEDLKSIHSLNSPEGKAQLNMLARDLSNNSSIDETQLTANKQKIGMAKNKAAFEYARK